jgi:hypothetical protein
VFIRKIKRQDNPSAFAVVRLTLSILFLFSSFLSATPDLAPFITQADDEQVSLSPDGKQLALLKRHEQDYRLIIVDTATMKATNQIYFNRDDTVGRYRWVNNKRLIIFLSSNQINKTQDASYGELYAIDADAEKGKFIFGYRSMFRRGKIKPQMQSEDKLRNRSWSSVISDLDKEPDHVLIMAKHWDAKSRYSDINYRYGTVYKLNINNGKTEQIAKVTLDNARVKYDEPSNTLWAYAQLADNSVVTEQYDFSKNSWKRFKTDTLSGKFAIISYSKKHQQLTVKDYCGNDTLSYCLLNPVNGKLTSVLSNPAANLSWLWFNPDNEVFAVSSFEDRQKFTPVINDDPRIQDLASFLDVFTDYKLSPNWSRQDNNKVLLSV